MRRRIKSSSRSTRESTLRRGFTLAEVLVTVAIVSLLAAVMIPAVAGQLSKGDVGRVEADLSNIRSGIEAFLSDVHRYPARVSDLTKSVTGNNDILGNAYPAALSTKWKGPYMQQDTVTFSGSTGAGLPTALGGTIINAFEKFTNAANTTDYVTVRIVGLTVADFNKIDADIDGVVNQTGGSLRFKTGTTVDTIKYLAIPIQ